MRQFFSLFFFMIYLPLFGSSNKGVFPLANVSSDSCAFAKIYLDGQDVAQATVCHSTEELALSGSFAYENGLPHLGLVEWTSSSTGGVFSTTTSSNTIYYPSEEDKATGFVRIVLRDIECSTHPDTLVIYFYPEFSAPSYSAVNTTGCSLSNGSINFSMEGGVAPFTVFFYKSPSPTLNQTVLTPNGGVFSMMNLGVGSYRIQKIVDANGCEATSPFFGTNIPVDKPPSPQIGGTPAAVPNPSCSECLGAIQIPLAVTGVAPYYFTATQNGSVPVILSAVPLVGNTVTAQGLCSGIYTNVMITDQNGCPLSIASTFNISSPTPPAIGNNGLTFTNVTTCETCNGTISVNINPSQMGSPPYRMRLDSNNISITRENLVLSADNRIIIGGLCGGIYRNVVVTDSRNCALEAPNLAGPFTLTAPSPPMISNVVISNDCTTPDGTIKLFLNTMQPIVAPFRIILEGASGDVEYVQMQPFSGVLTIPNVPPDNYSCIRIVDANNCSASVCNGYVVTSPIAVSYTVSDCPPYSKIDVTASGGTNLVYRWSNPTQSQTQDLTNVSAGTYTLTITDVPTNCARTVVITVRPCKDTVYQQVLIGASATVCIPHQDLPNGVSNVSICQAPQFGSVQLNNPDTCVVYTAGTNHLGNDIFCAVLCNPNGLCDTTIIIMTAYSNQLITNTFRDTIAIGGSYTYCPDLTELNGAITSVTNICPATNSNVQFYINGNCINYTGLFGGIDTACVVICDNLGICDTTQVIVMVDDYPDLIDDNATTYSSTPITIAVTENDIAPANLSITIPIQPRTGELSLNQDNTITYTAGNGFCGPTSFQYIGCTNSGCDTATVFITVECVKVKEFTVYTMMSPNGDGINDLLYIESIDKFPNSELYIYNRWGSQVHYAKGYQNNWDGTWNGKALPDGTYFYLLNLHNPAQKENLSGYIQIHR